MTTTRTAARPLARIALAGVALAGITVGALGTVAHASGPSELPPVDVCLLVPESCQPVVVPGPIHIDPSDVGDLVEADDGPDHATPTDTGPTVPTGEDPVAVDEATPEGGPLDCDPVTCPPKEESPCDIRVCTPIPEDPEVTTTTVAPPAEQPDVVVDPPVVARPTFTG